MVKAPNPTSFSMSSFCFSPPSKDFLQKGINVLKEDVIYNWIDISSICMSKTRKPFQTTKEFHPLTLQALIEVCFKVGSFVANLSISIALFLPFPQFLLCLCVFSLGFHSFPLTCSNIRACHAFYRHVLALEPNMDVFTKVLEPLVIISIPKATHLVFNIHD